MTALFNSLEPTLGTKDENIYLLWGLHFSTLKKGITIIDSKNDVVKKLLNSLSMWKDTLEDTKSETTKKSISEIIDWIEELIIRNFKGEAVNIINRQSK